MKQVPSLDYPDARRIADEAIRLAAELGVPLTAVVVDVAGVEQVRLRLDGGTIASSQLAGRKALSALTTRTPTAAWVGRVEQNPAPALSAREFPSFCAIPGGLPIEVDGQVVGAIGVSGGTFEQDSRIAAAAIAVLGSGRESQ
jgi:uncharacterized protein GlcG (DUF336 family)